MILETGVVVAVESESLPVKSVSPRKAVAKNSYPSWRAKPSVSAYCATSSHQSTSQWVSQ